MKTLRMYMLCVLVCLSIILNPSTDAIPRSRANADDSIVVISQHNSESSIKGCNSASIFRVTSGAPLFRAEQSFRGTIAGSFSAKTDLSLILAPGTRYGGDENFVPHLLALRPMIPDYSQWTQQLITGTTFASGKGIAIMPDDETLLVETFRNESGPTPGSQHAVSKFLLSEISANGKIGPERGVFTLPVKNSHLVPSGDGRRAHIMSNYGQGTIYTIDVGTMTQVAAPIDLPRSNGNGPKSEYVGSITKDERFMIIQRDDDSGPITSSINIADLVERTSWTLPINPLSCNTPFGINCGEVAINHGSRNNGLLAIRGGKDVGVFSFTPHGPLRLLSRWPLGPVDNDFVYPPIAWGGGGEYLFVGAANTSKAAVLVLRVTNDGNDLSPMRWLSGCEDADGNNAAFSIYTNNRALSQMPTLTPIPPTPLPTATVVSPTASATTLPSATPSSFPSPTSHPTSAPSPTFYPMSIYLPLSLREHCTPERKPVDVVLAVDTSTSMEERTVAGVRKLDDAIAAANSFLGLLHLDAGDRAAIVSFNAQARLEQSLTADRLVLTSALARMRPAQQTCLPCAVEVGVAELEAHPRPGTMTVLVLLTDGRSNPRPASEAEGRANVAKAAGIVFFTIALGSDVDSETLAAIASYPSAFLVAIDAGTMVAAYATIARALPCPPALFWGRR